RVRARRCLAGFEVRVSPIEYPYGGLKFKKGLTKGERIHRVPTKPWVSVVNLALGITGKER
ncbi:MAG: hypothetical protein ACN4E6_00305, partial [Qipengyuania pacifica]